MAKAFGRVWGAEVRAASARGVASSPPASATAADNFPRAARRVSSATPMPSAAATAGVKASR